jgi:hypothetical protein
MCGQVVEEDVGLSAIVGGDNLIHELEEFIGAAARKAVTHDFAGGGVQRRGEIHGPMTDVVMGALLSLRRRHWPQRQARGITGHSPVAKIDRTSCSAAHSIDRSRGSS